MNTFLLKYYFYLKLLIDYLKKNKTRCNYNYKNEADKKQNKIKLCILFIE